MRYLLLFLCLSLPLAAKEGCNGNNCNAILIWNGILTEIIEEQDDNHAIVIEPGTEPLAGKLNFAKNAQGAVYLKDASVMRFHVTKNKQRVEQFNLRVARLTVMQPSTTKGIAFKLDVNGKKYPKSSDKLQEITKSNSAVVTVTANGSTAYTDTAAFRVETYLAVSTAV